MISDVAETPAAGSSGGTFRSLRHRNFKLFFGGQLISQTGTWMTMVTQTLLVLRLSEGSGIAIGLLTACQFTPVLLLGVWAGAVADRADKRLLLIGLQAAALLQSLALAILLFSHHATIAAVYALAVVQGVITAFDNPCRRAFVVEMVPAADVANAVSLNTALMTGSRVFGPALGGALVVQFGFGWVFLIDAISYLAVLWGLWAMHTGELYSSERTTRHRGEVRDGLRYLRGNRRLFVPMTMMAIVGTLAFNFSVTMPLLVTNSLHRDEQTFTVLFSVLSVGSVVGALWTARRQTVTDHQLVVASTAFGLSMLAMSVVPGIVGAFVTAIPVGIASVMFMTSSTAIVQLLAAPQYRARVLAVQSMVFLGSTPIGGPTMGWICDRFGPRTGLAIGGVSCFIAALYGGRLLGVPTMPVRSRTMSNLEGMSR